MLRGEEGDAAPKTGQRGGDRMGEGLHVGTQRRPWW